MNITLKTSKTHTHSNICLERDQKRYNSSFFLIFYMVIDTIPYMAIYRKLGTKLILIEVFGNFETCSLLVTISTIFFRWHKIECIDIALQTMIKFISWEIEAYTFAKGNLIFDMVHCVHCQYCSWKMQENHHFARRSNGDT